MRLAPIGATEFALRLRSRHDPGWIVLTVAETDFERVANGWEMRSQPLPRSAWLASRRTLSR